MYLIKRQRELLQTNTGIKSHILACKSDYQKIDIVFERRKSIRQVSLFIAAPVFLKALCVSFVFMDCRASGLCFECFGINCVYHATFFIHADTYR